MKHIIIVMLLIIAILMIVGIYAPNIFMQSEEILKVGFAKVNISPIDENGAIIPVPLGGYAGLRICDSIESDIFATCTAFEDKNGNKVLIYSIDSIGVGDEITEKALTAISEQTNTPRENIILNCTHNHTSPESSSAIEEAGIYADLLIDALIEAATSAISDLSICNKLRVGEVSLAEFSYIRRTEDQTSVDAGVPVARFSRKNKSDVLLVNWAAHCDTISSTLNLACSSD